VGFPGCGVAGEDYQLEDEVSMVWNWYIKKLTGMIFKCSVGSCDFGLEKNERVCSFCTD
jgi:hypothetical protein